MKLYLAARYGRRDELRRYRYQLHERGHTVVSSWLDTNWNAVETEGTSAAAPPEHRARLAALEIEEVFSCDGLVFFAEPPRSNTRGGRHVEFGVALALGKQVLVIGDPENLFHYHPNVLPFPTFDHFLAYLIGL